jgi:RNA polymerase sigma factor (sigma-70 family)
VTVLEKTRVGDPATASFSLARSARNDYLDPEYARLAYEARQLWLALQAQSDEPLLVDCGCLNLAKRSVTPSSPCSRGPCTTSAASRPAGSRTAADRQEKSWVPVYQAVATALRPSRLQRPAIQPRRGSMHNDSSVIALVARVGSGDQEAWNEIIERYSPLVWHICLHYQLGREDIDDVGQTVWLLLVEHIGSLREPAALPGWLATTTRREALRVLRAGRRHEHADLPPEDQMPPNPDAATIEEEIVVAERNAALRAAFAELPLRCHELLSMLASDPPPAYAEVSAKLDIRVGSIGPTRARCLDRLRRSPHLAGIIGGEAHDVEVSGSGR